MPRPVRVARCQIAGCYVVRPLHARIARCREHSRAAQLLLKRKYSVARAFQYFVACGRITFVFFVDDIANPSETQMLRHPREDGGLVPFGIDLYDAEHIVRPEMVVKLQSLYLDSRTSGDNPRMAGIGIAPLERIEHRSAIRVAKCGLH